MGFYDHKNWMQIMKNDTMTCRDKQKKAFRKHLINIPLNGTEGKGKKLGNISHYTISLVYMAIMDCEGEIEKLYGND